MIAKFLLSPSSKFSEHYCIMKMIYFVGVDGQYIVTIVSNPAGTPVSGFTNTFDYPILSSVTLTCDVTLNDTS